MFFDYAQLDETRRRELLLRPRIDYASLFGTVQAIIDQVREDRR